MRPCPRRATAFRTQSILFLAVGMISAALAQQPFVPAPHKPVPPLLPQPAQWHTPATSRSAAGGLWRTDANFKSAIYIHNDVQTSPLHVTPILYISNGTRLVLPEVTLEPAGIAVVDINAALQQLGIAAWATLSGYVEIDYQWPWDALCVTVRNVDPLHSELFNYGLGPGPQSHTAEEPSQANTMEGLWWKHERNVSAFVAVANISAQAVNATLEVSDAAPRAVGEHALTIPPHETKLINLAELQSATTAEGGIRVSWEGHGDELAVNGGLEDPATGYSAQITFRPVAASSATPVLRTYAELGLMTGAADPMMRFPANTTFTPYSVLRNASAQSISATPTLWWMHNGAARSARLQPVTVAPYHTVDLGVPSLLAAAGLAHFNGEVNLTLEVEGPPHELLLAGGSVDQTGTYVFAITPMAILESVGKAASYWSTGNGDDTMVTLWNPADEAQDFTLTLFFSGGHYAFPVHLEPRATRMVNLSDIVNSGIADAEGNRIPPGIHEGSAELTGSQGVSQHILVAMDVGVYNVQKATCSGICNLCHGADSSWISPDPFSVAVDSSTQLTFTAQYDTGGQYNLTSAATWTSTDTAYATVSAGSVTGVLAGSVDIDAEDYDTPDYTYGCNYGEKLDCPIAQGVSGSASGTMYDATPVISSVNPTSFVVGGAASFTISGQNLGTNCPQLTFPFPASYSLSSCGDQSVSGTVTPSGAGSGDLVLTAEGFNGQPFQQSPGQSQNAKGPQVQANNPPPPSITGVSPSPFVAGQTYQNVSVSGANFGVGTACPTSVSITGAGESNFYVSVAYCTPTSLEGTVTMDWAAASGSLVVTTAGGTATYTLKIAALNMQLSQVGNIAISTDGKYSEDATVKVQAVRSDDGAAITNFTGTVAIAEDGTAIYSQNGGALPSEVTISSNGTVNFMASSLAGPKSSSAGPDAAKLKVTNYPMYKSTDLQVPQWVHTGTIIDTHASGAVPDWMQARTRDIFANATGNGNSVANNRAVLATVASYTAVSIPFAGQTTPSHSATSALQINPYYNVSMRLDSAGGPVCSTTSSRDFTNTFYHEARHAYQFSQASIAGNDKDSDYAVENVSIAPTNIFTDTTTERTVCNESAGTTFLQSFLGDTVADPFTNVSYALEEDASVFAQN